MNKSTTDTPRTDFATELYENNTFIVSVVPVEFARQLELELSHSLANQLKTQAEIERLKANLRRAVDIADVLRSGGSRACRELHHSKRDQHEYGEVCPVEERLKKAESELDQLKATFNQEKK